MEFMEKNKKLTIQERIKKIEKRLEEEEERLKKKEISYIG